MQSRQVVLFLFVVAQILGALSAGAAGPPTTGDIPPNKVDSWVWDKAAVEGKTEFILFLNEQADLSGASAFKTKRAKGIQVYRALSSTAARTQGPLIKVLRAMGAEHRPFWVANMIWVSGDSGVLNALARRTDVAHVFANPSVRLSQPPREPAIPRVAAPTAIGWNISLVNAPAVWAAGSTGQGVVVGGQDTGYRWDHPALKSQYRGWNGVSANHDYNWHDSIHTGSSSCGTDSPVPCDDDQHGTHTMGTMVGDDGGGNGIGMAPGARWIGCRNMREGIGTPYTYIECYQWFIAPTRVDRTDPDPAMAPDVINNSWSCPPREGCDDPNMLRTVVNNVRAAGIITVHAAGNSGSACGTVDEPAAIYKSSFSVGATNDQDIIASFSSRGPVTVDGSGRRKPDISAPGVGVRSSLPPDGYGAMSGTSMAAPHVAGLCALVLAANPDLAGRVDVVENILKRSALPLTSDQGCGGDGPQDVPNNVYGWGRIDGLAAYQEATTGSITVKIGPSAANASGAAWRVNDGIWRESGHTLSGLAPGQYTISFKPIEGWRRPPGMLIDVAGGLPTTARGSYVRVDVYEDDNKASRAKPIQSGELQERSIDRSGDVDWAKFDLARKSEVVLTTGGPGGDTQMWLYGPNNPTTLVEYDNDGGTGRFSRIERTGNEALGVGSYYIKIQERGRDKPIPEYTLKLVATPAP